MKKIIIVCTAVIFSATVSAQNAGSAGNNTSTVSVYKSPEILTDKAVAEAKKASLSNNVAPAPAPVGSNTRAQPNPKPAPVVTKPVEVTKAEQTTTPPAPVNAKPVPPTAPKSPAASKQGGN